MITANDKLLTRPLPNNRNINGIIYYTSIIQNNWFTIDCMEQTLLMLIVDISKDNNIEFIKYDGWSFHYSPIEYTVSGRVVLPLSNNLNTRLLDIGEPHETLNLHSYYSGRIVLLYRGEIPFVLKILHIQSAGGIGVIIVDNTNCIDYTQHCIAGATKINNEKIGINDKKGPW